MSLCNLRAEHCIKVSYVSGQQVRMERLPVVVTAGDHSPLKSTANLFCLDWFLMEADPVGQMSRALTSTQTLDSLTFGLVIELLSHENI